MGRISSPIQPKQPGALFSLLPWAEIPLTESRSEASHYRILRIKNGILKKLWKRIFGSGHFRISEFPFFGVWWTTPPRAVTPTKMTFNCCNCCLKVKPHGFWIPPNTTHTTLSKNSWHHARVMHVSLFSGHPSDAHLHLKEKIKNSHSMIFARENLICCHFVLLSDFLLICSCLLPFYKSIIWWDTSQQGWDFYQSHSIAISRSIGFSLQAHASLTNQDFCAVDAIDLKTSNKKFKNHQRTTEDTLIALQETFAKDPCPRAIPGVHSPKL